VRPAEMDFDTVKFLLMCLTVVTLLVSFISQIEQIVRLCSGPFLCPQALQSGWIHRPVWAPPVSRRVVNDFKETMTSAYYRGTSASCTSGSAGCTKPGYLVEWPYIQQVAGSGEMTFPQELKSVCTAVVAGVNGYVYDPTTATLKGEFWQCSDSSTAFRDGGTPFHFTNNWYQEANRVTKKCMKKVKPDPNTWAASFNEFNGALLEDLEICFLNDPVWINFNSGGKCDCKTGNAFWMLSDNSVGNIRTHNMYGCFFASPTAADPVSLQYYACSATPTPQVQTGANTVNRQRQEAEELAASGLSRKTALVTFFVFKEAGPFGAFVGALIICVIFAVLVPPLAILVTVIGGTMLPHRKTHFKNEMWKLCESGFSEATNTIWPLCLGMSNTFRCWETVRRVFFAEQINASLVKDGINKVTALLNILFNLVVLVFSDTTFAEGGLLWVSIIMSAANVIIQILLEKEKLKYMTSLFKDINENRLTKFEIAVGITKCMEDMLEDDVQYNFVQHLGGDTRVVMKELMEYEGEEKKNPGAFAKEWNTCNEEEESEMSNGKWRDLVCGGPIQNAKNPTIFNFYPLLPQKLVDKFSHDGLYEFSGDVDAPGGMTAATVLVNKTPHTAMTHSMPGPQMAMPGYPMMHPMMPNMMMAPPPSYGGWPQR